MAYNNYGAFVFQDGKRRRDREDVAVFDDENNELPSGARIFANIQKRIADGHGAEGGGQPWWEHTHHAVLGDGDVRLAGYKNYAAELYHRRPDGTVERIGLEQFDPEWDGDDVYQMVASCRGEYAGCVFDIVADIDTVRRLKLRLVEPDGSVWEGECGAQFGAGFEKDDNG